MIGRGGDRDVRRVLAAGPVHFVGVAGSGMFALAELLARSGVPVSGCDLKEGHATRVLEGLGARIFREHDPAHLAGARAVVYSPAVPAAHPELAAARERDLPVIKRAEALGLWVNPGTVVGVAGTHGKTTTTVMATHVLEAAGREPTGVGGGRVEEWGSHLRFGDGDLFVVEADEFDRSFHRLEPDVAVVTNLEADHLDVYEDLDGVRDAFRTYVEAVPEGGRVAVCADDPGSASLLAGVGARGYTYGLSAGSQLRAVAVEMDPEGVSFHVLEEGVDRGPLRLGAPGRHNLANALGAAAAARALGVEWDAVREGLRRYRGVGRRFQRMGEPGGVAVVDDYAHHPTEIRSTLEAVREIWPGRRRIVVFQPHLFSRTRDFHVGFGRALAEGSDLLWLTGIFPAREEPIPGVTAELVVDAAREAGGAEVRYHEPLEGLAEAVADSLGAGDVCVVMGAGSVEVLAPRLTRILGGEEADHA